MSKTTYEAWRISFQSSEQAAKAAYDLLKIAIAERDAALAQVEQLRDAAKPVVDDYFNWLEVNEIDTEDLQPSYQRVFDMMTALNNQLRQAAKGGE
jgi:phage-related protein